MESYIKKDSLRAAIRDLWTEYNQSGFEYVSKDDVFRAIEEMDEIEVDEWIPVDEELPDVGKYGDSEYILLSFDNYPVPCIGQYREDKEGGAFYAGDDDESLVSVGLIVNAWRYLPESYKEDENGNETD